MLTVISCLPMIATIEPFNETGVLFLTILVKKLLSDPSEKGQKQELGT